MIKTRKSKKAIIQDDLTKKIKGGIFAPGTDFPTIAELMTQYNISMVTAGKIIRSLGQSGFLEVSRGRKSKVVIQDYRPNPHQLSLPVAIVSPVDSLARQVRWRNAMMQQLQYQLLIDENSGIWLPETFQSDMVHGNYSGIIYATERVPEEQWQSLMDAKIPCVRPSFSGISFNTVLIDLRQTLDRLALHICQSDCRRIVLLEPTEMESEEAKNWYLSSSTFFATLDAHGITSDQRIHLAAIPHEKIGMNLLTNEMKKREDKTAWIVPNTLYEQHLAQFLNAMNQKLHEDYKIYCMSITENEIPLGHGIDMKYTAVANRMLDMFYRQYNTGQPQLGEVIAAEFVLADGVEIGRLQ